LGKNPRAKGRDRGGKEYKIKICSLKNHCGGIIMIGDRGRERLISNKFSH